MARARNIKPSFFMNEDLAELDFSIRLLFIGLWTLADREGRLEDRPRRIKRELFASDNIDIDDALAQLEKYEFIKRYKIDDLNIIQVVKFKDHQSPHGTEKDSELPDENGYLTVNKRTKSGLVTKESDGISRENAGSSQFLTVKEQLSNDTETVNASCNNALNPDSLNPDSLPSTSAREEILTTVHENQTSPPPTRKGQLCRQLRSIGVDAVPHKLDESDWVTILEKRTDEEITAFAESVMAKKPGDRVSLGYLAKGLLDDPKPIALKNNGKSRSAHGQFERIDYSHGINADGSF